MIAAGLVDVQINCRLAVSRSLGDSQFKASGEMVSAEPAVKSVHLVPQDRVVVVASGKGHAPYPTRPCSVLHGPCPLVCLVLGRGCVVSRWWGLSLAVPYLVYPIQSCESLVDDGRLAS